MRTSMIRCDDRIVLPAVKRGAVVVIERRDSQEGPRTNRAKPGNIVEAVTLPLKIVDAGGLIVGGIRNLVVILSNGTHDTELVRGRRFVDEGCKPPDTRSPIVNRVEDGRF